MRQYTLERNYRLLSKITPKGTQQKYYRNGYFYKTGNEGLAEHLCSKVLSFSSLPESAYVKYEYCGINGKLGCRSKTFLKPSEEFITINTLFIAATGYTNIADYLFSLSSASVRLNYVLDLVASFGVDREIYRRYLNTILQFDMLVANTDRHPHNYGIVRNNKTNSYRVPPLFDNGCSLNTNRLGDYTSCTISGSFEEQVKAFGYPVKPCFTINYKRLFADLNTFEKTYGKSIELKTLKYRLWKYEDIFCFYSR